MPIAFTCPHCGLRTNVPDDYAGHSGPCAGCGQGIMVPPLARAAGPGSPFGPAPDMGADPAVRMLLPVGRSGLAIAAGYAGLIPCLGPVAILLGILAIRDLKKNPNKHGMGRAIFGVVMGRIVTLLLIPWVIGLGAGPGM